MLISRTGATRLADLSDYDAATVEDGEFLKKDPDGSGKVIGVPVSPGGGSDASYTHNQAVPATSWVVAHGLGKFPAITVVDSAGTEVEGQITHNSANQATLTFSVAFGGKAYCN